MNLKTSQHVLSAKCLYPSVGSLITHDKWVQSNTWRASRLGIMTKGAFQGSTAFVLSAPSELILERDLKAGDPLNK